MTPSHEADGPLHPADVDEMADLRDPGHGDPAPDDLGDANGVPLGSSPKRSVADRLRSRVSADLRSALVDPSQVPTGDFDIVVQQPGRAGDRVATFAGLITAMRLATTAISLLLVSTSTDTTVSLRVWTAVVVGYAIFRAFRPIRYTDDVNSLVRVIGEVGLHVVAVVATGGWDSPFIFTLLTAITVAGFARGFGFALRIGIASVLAVTFPFINDALDRREALLQSAEWAGIVLLVAIVAGYARRISGEADRQHSLALDRLGRLADANALLFSLHRVTQTLPASLDLDDVLDTTMGRLRSLVRLRLRRRAGLRRHRRQLGGGAPRGPARPRSARRPPSSPQVCVGDRPEPAGSPLRPVDPTGGGLSNRAGSGIYAVLAARGSIIGLLAVEHSDFNHFTDRDLELLEGFVEPVALAIDNARWFGRLRTVGADEERTRIARDLHDRIGQSLAYLAFELDRHRRQGGERRAHHRGICLLRDDVRGVIREVRDTLYDLRTDVSDSRHGRRARALRRPRRRAQ